MDRLGKADGTQAYMHLARRPGRGRGRAVVPLLRYECRESHQYSPYGTRHQTWRTDRSPTSSRSDTAYNRVRISRYAYEHMAARREHSKHSRELSSASSRSPSLVPIRFGAYPTPLPPKRLVSFGPGTSLRDRQVTTGSADLSQHGGKAAAPAGFRRRRRVQGSHSAPCPASTRTSHCNVPAK